MNPWCLCHRLPEWLCPDFEGFPEPDEDGIVTFEIKRRPDPLLTIMDDLASSALPGWAFIRRRRARKRALARLQWYRSVYLRRYPTLREWGSDETGERPPVALVQVEYCHVSLDD